MPRNVYKRREKLSKLEQGTTRLATRPDLRIQKRHEAHCHLAVDEVGEYVNCYRPLGGCDCVLSKE